MTRKARAQVVTVAVMAAVLLLVAGKNLQWPQQQLTPAVSAVLDNPDGAPLETIYRMLDAAKQGDVDRYLACYGGQMASHLRQVRDEMSPAAFAEYLKRQNKEVKGFAIGEPEPLSDQEVTITVEYVYQDRNESQPYYLQKESGDWRITRVDETEQIETVVPYGTPAY